MPIGGLKEKALAAYRYGIKEIIIPKGNLKDLEEIPKNIRDEIIFHPVSHAKQVLDLALLTTTTKALPQKKNHQKGRDLTHEYS